MQLVLPVARGDGLDPVGMLAVQVVHRDGPAFAVEVLDDAAGDPAPVEGVAAAFGNLPVGPGEAGVAEHLSVARRPSAGQVGLAEVLPLGDGLRPVGPVGGDDLRDREPVFRVLDGRLQDLGQRHRAVPVEKGRPAVNRSGDAHRIRAMDGNLLEAAAGEEVEVHRFRREAAAVQSDQPVLLWPGRPGRTYRRRARSSWARRPPAPPPSPRRRRTRCRPVAARGVRPERPAVGWRPPFRSAPARRSGRRRPGRRDGRPPERGPPRPALRQGPEERCLSHTCTLDSDLKHPPDQAALTPARIFPACMTCTWAEEKPAFLIT